MNTLRRLAPALASLALASTALTGCLEHPVKTVQYNSVVACDEVVDVTPRREVDILFVIDNSGSMGEEQAILSANFERFVDKLDIAGANYRLAVTTTDVGNSIYCNDSTPEDGAFVLSTCHDRAEHFYNEPLDIDRFVEACEQHCPAEFAGAGTTPSQIAESEELVARPWIEHFGNGVTNLADMTPSQAFQCFGPQGIDGCGYNESPLQAMYRALERSQDPNDPAYGFVREDALLAVVFITDENDCSVAEHAIDIFHPNGDRAFWEDKSLGGPTSAVCWNA
ncbi:MAG: VWA domain-containing protein, partial [Myxococcales bacterium]|nr:VWA domain-containing protein [Myxococcales bacterium]